MLGLKKGKSLLFLVVLLGLITAVGCSSKTMTDKYSSKVVLNENKESSGIIADNGVHLSSGAPLAMETEKLTIIPDKTDETNKDMEKTDNIDTTINSEVNSTEQSTLHNKIIFIDPGHQLKADNSKERIAPTTEEIKAKVTSGTSGVSTGKPEYELNLEVGLKLKDLLIENGAIAYMTREINDVSISNMERAIMANEQNADLVIRLHADGDNSPAVNGYSILVPDKKYINDEDMLQKSYTVAKSIKEEFDNNLHTNSRGIIKRSDLTGFNWSKVPVVLIEMGFMTNTAEDERLSTVEFQSLITNSIVEALKKYYQPEL